MEPNIKFSSEPKTLQDAIVYYADEQNCLDFIVSTRWPNGVCCPRCGDIDVVLIERITRKQDRTIWRCHGCKKQFSAKVGTIFEDSPLPLSKWLVAMWLLVGAKNGISSYELSRALGTTQRTAWFMLHRIREAIRLGSIEKFRGPVEADETVIGGSERNKHADKRLPKMRGGDHARGKTIVMGVLDRGDASRKSQVKAEIIRNTTRATLQTEIRETVHQFATLYTDAYVGYQGLSAEYLHEFVDHTVMYAIGQVHTNGIENFWALLKRMLKGTYISIEPFHLARYIDEMVFRFNERGGTDRDRFVTAVGMISGKRLTYNELTSAYEGYYQQVLPRPNEAWTA
jgi:transposase-like protein